MSGTWKDLIISIHPAITMSSDHLKHLSSALEAKAGNTPRTEGQARPFFESLIGLNACFWIVGREQRALRQPTQAFVLQQF